MLDDKREILIKMQANLLTDKNAQYQLLRHQALAPHVSTVAIK